jgi:hypothetical protein
MAANVQRLSTEAHPILAVVYSDGRAADLALADLGYALLRAGVRVAGVVQHNHFVRSRARCTMIVEDLSSGTTIRISDDRGSGARGCTLDRAALCEVASLLGIAVAAQPALLIINKFGKAEFEGEGLRDVIVDAVTVGVPIIIGVPQRNLDQWHAFAGDLSEDAPLGSARVHGWMMRHGVGLEAHAAGSHASG